MTTTTLTFIMLAVSIAVFIATKVIEHFCREYRYDFIGNYVGGVLAICGISDFKKGEPVAGGLIKVCETLAFSNHRGDFFSGSLIFNGTDIVPECDLLADYKSEPKLFVPFTSERFSPIWEQRDYFAFPLNPEEFAERKRRENRKQDWTMRIWDLRISDKFPLVQNFSGLAAMTLLMIITLKMLST